ncbi:MAG: heme lyase CcmF/NrfE family subunit [Candidatus Latescibacterota bacterium]
MTDVGYLALCLALVTAGYTVAAALAGARRGSPVLVRSAENGLLAVGALLTLAVVALWHALLTRDFQVQYVAENSNRAMSSFYTVAALWGGQNGSLLFWGWVLSLYGVAVVLVNRHRHRALMPYVVAVLASTGFFFALLHLFAADPFQRLPFTPPDGRGLNPLLQHPAMAIHPPMLYLGMVGMAVPFAFAIAALATRQLGNAWLRPARRWMLIPWAFLGLGLLLGGKWAYVELGWGGYWGWDPVENSSLMPWLAATAFLHSIMIQERKGMLKVWNMVLVVLTYALCIFGTFLTRSGMVTSVHSFARSSIGPFFAVFLGLLLVGSFGLVVSRLRYLRAENRLEAFASRETAFLLNNWILVGMLFAVLWGTTFPLLSEAFTGDQVTVGPPFFNRINVPAGLVLLLLTGLGPLFAWRRTQLASLRRTLALPVATALLTVAVLAGGGMRDPYAVISLALCALVATAVAQEFHQGTRARQRSTGEGYLQALYRLSSRNRRRYGGYLVHMALVLLFVGFTGKAFTTEREFVLEQGEAAQIGAYRFTYEAPAHAEDANMVVDAAAVSLHRDGRLLSTLLPERRFYKAFEQGTTEVSIYSTLRQDVYLILVGFSQEGRSAKFQVFVNPLVNFVWFGGLLFVAGALWCMWPTARERRLAALDRRAVQDGYEVATALPAQAGPGA